ncbi:MAG: hypothetical protein AAGA15_17020 [Pseudomonadota bacterium]
MSSAQSMALKVAAILWVIWGLVHAFAGIAVMTTDAPAGFALIADAVDPEIIAHDYVPSVKGVLNQHSWNLLWAGCVTVIGGVFVWRASFTAIWVTAMVGGLFDLGYFLFMDLPGFVHFFPGTVMTLVSSAAIVLSFWVWLTNRKTAAA